MSALPPFTSSYDHLDLQLDQEEINRLKSRVNEAVNIARDPGAIYALVQQSTELERHYQALLRSAELRRQVGNWYGEPDYGHWKRIQIEENALETFVGAIKLRNEQNAKIAAEKAKRQAEDAANMADPSSFLLTPAQAMAAEAAAREEKKRRQQEAARARAAKKK